MQANRTDLGGQPPETTDPAGLVHWVYGDEPVAICGSPFRQFYGDEPGVTCVVCLDLDAVYSKLPKP